MIAPADITGVILAGGRGRRMGGQDKGWLDWRGRPLVEHAMDCFATQVATTMISANRHLPAYRALGVPVVSDTLPGYPGPLAGALAAMTRAQTPWVALLPVDMPRLSSRVFERLRASASGHDIVICHDGERLQPLVALMRTRLRGDLSHWLGSEGGKVFSWYDRHRWHAVDGADFSGVFDNCNTPQEFERVSEAERDR